MSLWLMLLLVQPLLVVNRKHRMHRSLGTAGAGLAFFIVLVGLDQVYLPRSDAWS